MRRAHGFPSRWLKRFPSLNEVTRLTLRYSSGDEGKCHRHAHQDGPAVWGIQDGDITVQIVALCRRMPTRPVSRWRSRSHYRRIAGASGYHLASVGSSPAVSANIVGHGRNTVHAGGLFAFRGFWAATSCPSGLSP